MLYLLHSYRVHFSRESLKWSRTYPLFLVISSSVLATALLDWMLSFMAKARLFLTLASAVPSLLTVVHGLPHPEIGQLSQGAFLDIGTSVQMGNMSFPDLESAFMQEAASASHGDDGHDDLWLANGIDDFRLDPSFQIRVNSTACGEDNVTHIFDALTEVRQAVFNGTTLLLQDPLAEINRLYWGSPSTGDLSTPVGVLGQVLYSNKDEVSITCELDTKKECSDAAKVGAYVDKDKGSVHLCDSVFQSDSKKKFIEDICQEGRTLSDNKPLDFWSPLLLKLLLELPQITHNSLLRSPAESYADVLHAARIDAVASTHNIPSYLYFILDNVAQQQVLGGCRGEEEKSILIHKKIEA